MDTAVVKKSVETLALLIASKTGIDDNFASVARKVIGDYIGAKRIIQEYNESATRKVKKPKEKKAGDDKKRKEAKKAAKKNAKQAAGE